VTKARKYFIVDPRARDIVKFRCVFVCQARERKAILKNKYLCLDNADLDACNISHPPLLLFLFLIRGRRHRTIVAWDCARPHPKLPYFINILRLFPVSATLWINKRDFVPAIFLAFNYGPLNESLVAPEIFTFVKFR
jgi:hypothetical protein